jgi:hypothetical protein
MDHLRAKVFFRVFQFKFLRDRDSVVADNGLDRICNQSRPAQNFVARF